MYCFEAEFKKSTKIKKELFILSMSKYVYDIVYFKALSVLCTVLFPVGLAWGKWVRNDAVASNFLLHLKDIKSVLIWDTKIISYS